MRRDDDGPPPPVPDPAKRAELIASQPIYQPPSPSPVYITEEEAKRVAGVPEGARSAQRFLAYRDVEQIDPALHGNALVPPDRMVWVVAVATDVMTRGTLREPPRRAHGYSVVIDGETGHAFTSGTGVIALDVS